MTERRPRVSVMMPNHNGGFFIGQSIRSALRQTMADLEILVCDDGSTDDSLAVLGAIAATDRRVRVIASPAREGISRTRNRLLDAAYGEWLAPLDSDALFHPERLARLLAAAERHSADLVADDLLEFPERADRAPKLLLGRPRPFPIGAAPLIRRAHVLGYLKPVWRAAAMRGVRYNPEMLVAEDFDFACRMVIGGARYVFHPEALYFYRKHERSASAGSDRRKQRSVLVGDDRFRDEVPLRGGVLLAAAGRRRRVLRHMSYDDAIEALRRRDWPAVLRTILHHPSSTRIFRINIEARWGRLRRRLGRAPGTGPALLVLLRAGDERGASAIAALLRLAAAVGLERRVVLFRSRSVRPRVPPGFDRVVPVLWPARTPLSLIPSAAALAIATEMTGVVLVVAADPSLGSCLPYRIDDGVPALVAVAGELPTEPAALRLLLARTSVRPEAGA